MTGLAFLTLNRPPFHRCGCRGVIEVKGLDAALSEGDSPFACFLDHDPVRISLSRNEPDYLVEAGLEAEIGHYLDLGAFSRVGGKSEPPNRGDYEIVLGNPRGRIAGGRLIGFGKQIETGAKVPIDLGS